MSRFIVVLLVVLLVATFAAPAYAGKPPATKEPRSHSPDKCESSGTCGNGDHGMGQDKENSNPNSWKGEPDPPSTPTAAPNPPTPVPDPPTPVPDPPTPVPDPPTPVPDPPADDVVEISANSDAPCASCDICEELAEIKANQEIMIGLLNAIIELLGKILVALS